MNGEGDYVGITFHFVRLYLVVHDEKFDDVLAIDQGKVTGYRWFLSRYAAGF